MNFCFIEQNYSKKSVQLYQHFKIFIHTTYHLEAMLRVQKNKISQQRTSSNLSSMLFCAYMLNKLRTELKSRFNTR